MKPLVPFAFVLLTILLLQSADAKPSPAAKQPDSSSAAPHKPPAVQIWESFYHAKINWRYHIAEAGTWSWWNRMTTAAVVMLGVVSFGGPFVYQKSKAWKIGWGIVGTAALVVSSLQLIWPYGEWASEHRIQASRWNQLASEWYELYEAQPSLDPKELREQIAVLNRAASEIENDEPVDRFDANVMLAAEKAEKEFQGLKSKTAPDPNAQASRRTTQQL